MKSKIVSLILIITLSLSIVPAYGSSTSPKEVLDKAEDTVKKAGDKVVDEATKLKDEALEKADELKDKAEDLLKEGTDKVKEEAKKVEDKVKEEEKKFVKDAGEVYDIRKSEKSHSIVVLQEDHEKGKENESSTVYHLNEHVKIYDGDGNRIAKYDEIEVGDKVIVFISSKAPYALSLPPQTTPEAIIVGKKDTEFVKYDYFDENLVSSDNSLKLNLTDTTDIVDESGKKLNKDAVKDNNLLVYYTNTTKSIPAQTSPKKVIVMDKGTKEEIKEGIVGNPLFKNVKAPKEIMEIINNLDEEYIKEVDGKTYLAIAPIAKADGYDVKWIEKTSTVILNKADSHLYTFVIGNKDYKFGKEKLSLKEAPVIMNFRTFIEASFFENFSK